MKKSAVIVLMVALFAGSAFAKDGEICNGNGTKTLLTSNTNSSSTDSAKGPTGQSKR